MCLHPVVIRHAPDAIGRCTNLVPCGKCEECLKDRQNEYMIRSYIELFNSPSTFFTFTYAPSKVPFVTDSLTGEQYWSLDRHHVRNLLDYTKKFCKRNGIPFPRYLLCGEYGEKGFR